MGKHTGKKRWRKNDISDIQSALTSKNILQEHLGTSVDKLHSLPSESLFVIDKTSKEKPKSRTKDYYRNKKLSYQVELEPSHIVAPKTLQNENVDKEKLAKQAIERAVQRIERKQELAQAAKPPKKKELPKVYDIWETAPEPRKEIVARPYPQKIIRRKPSELPAVEIPTTDISYNPSETSINAVNQTLQKIEKKVRARTSKLDKLIRPQRARSLTELEKTIRLTTKQRLQVRKAIRKQVRTRSKPSKPGKKAVDPNYSMKMTRTQRNKLIKKKIRRKLLHKMLREEKRSKNLDKVEKIVSELDEKARRAQKRLLRRKLKDKLKIQMKRIKHKFFALPKTTATLSSARSLRSFKPSENMIHEKVLRYQERNILAV